MDRSLDDIVSERQQTRGPRGPRRGGRRNDRNEQPRDDIRKSMRDEPRDLDSEWVHDKYNDNTSNRPTRPRRSSPDRERSYAPPSSKLRVENLHYDLTEHDLDDLFSRIGPVSRLELLYDRAGRSEGVAYVSYESAHDAATAVREYDGANANGQPIRLIPVPTGPGGSGGRRNPFDSAVLPPRPLEDRITRAGDSRNRSYSPVRRTNVSGPPPPNVDRYVPGQGRSRSPRPRRREGAPPGARRERGDRAERGGRGREGGGRSEPRPKKTQDELDAEMEDYFAKENAKGGPGASAAAPEAAPAAQVDTAGDIEMAE